MLQNKSSEAIQSLVTNQMKTEKLKQELLELKIIYYKAQVKRIQGNALASAIDIIEC